MGEHNIKRGEKWKNAIELATLQHREADVKWFNSQESIVNDIKEYEADVEVKKKAEAEEERTKSKVKK